MVRKLDSRGIKVPTGFATTADAYWHFIKTNRLEPLIVSKFAEFKAAKATVTEIGSAIRSAILKGEWPEDLAAPSAKPTKISRSASAWTRRT